MTNSANGKRRVTANFVQNNDIFPLASSFRRFGYGLLPLLSLLLAGGTALAQRQPPKPAPQPKAAPMTAPAATPAVSPAATPTVGKAPAAAPTDTLRVPLGRKGGKRDIESTITYTARDSIRLDAPGKVAYLYGDAHIVYGTTDLRAELVRIDYGTNVVTAEGAPDSTGQLVGTPVFQDKGEQYEAKKIAYNFKTKKGKITEAITKQGEGYIHAEAVRRQSDNELYGLNGQYTTCDQVHPHFYINASKMKVVPGDKIVTGPFNLVVGDIPLPVGFLFGFFPTPKTRSSGILIPSYGESAARGFFLLNGGYYWAVNEHIGARFTGDFYTLGGWAARSEVQYKKRYHYDGNFRLEYLRNQPTERIGVSTDLNASRIDRPPDAIRVNWSHNPVQRPGGGRFSASVNAGSTGFYRGQANTTQTNYLTTTFNSSINYSKAIRNSPFNYTIALQQSQNSGVAGAPRMDFTLPSVSFGMAQQTPLRWLALRTGYRVFNNFTVSYTFSGQRTFSTVFTPGGGIAGINNIVGQETKSRNLTLQKDGLAAILRNGNTDVAHRFNVGLGSYSVAHITLSPGVTYDEQWTFRKFGYSYVPDSNGVRVDTARGLYRIYRYAYNLNANTRLYGTLTFGKKSKVQAIRATFNPSVSYSYSPNYGDASFGYYQNDVRVDSAGTIRDLPRYTGAPAGGKSSVLGFSLNISPIEMKLRPAEGDTTGKPRKVTLINMISFSTAYNLLADSLRLSPISANMNTRVGVLNLNLTGTFDPYQRDTAGRTISRYLIDGPGRKLARLASANLNVSFALNPQQRQRPGGRRPPTPSTVPDMVGGPGTNPQLTPASYTDIDYVPFELPWTLNVQFGLNYRAPLPTGPLTDEPVLQASTVTAGGSVRLTKKWAIDYSTPFDFRTMQLVSPRLGITRDLHCWVLNVIWVPTGQLQSYNVQLSARSSMLADILKLKRDRSWYNR